MRMGLPHVIVSEDGKDFDNQLNADITGLLGIQHRLITPYHPQVRVLVISYYFIVKHIYCVGYSLLSHRLMAWTNVSTKPCKQCW